MVRGPLSPAPTQPVDAPYVYQPWPSWYYGPDGQTQIFNSEREVPSGWSREPEDVQAPTEPPPAVLEGAAALRAGGPVFESSRTLTADQRVVAINKLVDGNTQIQLVDMLNAMYEIDARIEYSASWPKHRLAETIVDNGGPLEEPTSEEE